MDMHHDNPILSTFAVGGQTRQLTCTETPSPEKPRRVPPAIEKMISELGFRYRPTSQADLQAHAAALALLAVDLADMPPRLLERAIAKHVVQSPYMPKAADLVAIAKSFITQPAGFHGAVGETMADRGNRLMKPEHARVMRWVDDGERGAFLEWA